MSNDKFVHLSAGELLREELESGTQHGELIRTYINEGWIVPVEITCRLLSNAMMNYGWAHSFLIDGFPRNLDNWEGWKQEMGDKTNLQGVLWFDCDE